MKTKKLKGFTLVEVMTSLVILSIMIVIASSVIITTFNIFGKNSVMRAAQNEGNNIYNFLYERLSYSTYLKINSSVDINSIGDNYYEEIVISGLDTGNGHISLKRKNMEGVAVDIFGTPEKTPYNFKCEVVLSEETEKDNEGNDITEEGRKLYRKDIINCTVRIIRDNETLYEKNGFIPLYNGSKSYVIQIGEETSEQHETDNSLDRLKIFYEYIQ